MKLFPVLSTFHFVALAQTPPSWTGDLHPVCPGELPEIGWPPNWSRSDFLSFEELCDAFNVGCFCRQGSVMCIEQGGRRELFAAFSEDCLTRCFCLDFLRGYEENLNPNEPSELNSLDMLSNMYRGRRPWRSSGRTGQTGRASGESLTGARLHTRCGAQTCFSQRSCEGQHCRCTAQPHPRLDQMGPDRQWEASCGTRLSPRSDGGEAAATACPCNCTYVSGSCCGNSTGVVHEERSRKLGVLRPPDGQCCNAQTGEMQDGQPGRNGTEC
ncbi:MAG: hypothetical protein M1832_006355 [Thelocarpon impressellum]|nr:MAG: hypothetical protein M1832_006355 [Thelocarpon impressellum]